MDRKREDLLRRVIYLRLQYVKFRVFADCGDKALKK